MMTMTNKIIEKYRLTEVINHQKFTKEELVLLEKAFLFAEKAHAGQLRKSGEPYFSHPFETAKIVSELGFDADTIAAALLHDVLEDTEVTPEDIKNEFGRNIYRIVSGVSELSKVRFKNPKLTEKETTSLSTAPEIENLRKMFAATAKDIRVMIIKLADRLHNLRTLKFLPREKQVRIAKESLLIYGPIADRLSMGQLKGEIEDLSFKFAYPEKYAEVLTLLEDKIKGQKNITQKLKRAISRLLKEEGIEHEIDGRVKHIYSLHKKIIKLRGNIDRIHDFVALRVIVPDETFAYLVLGLIHKNYKPLPGCIKDYIARPKPNGYQSLHTTVFVKNLGIFEIQIRTPKMHENAEQGVASHFHYTEIVDPKFKDKKASTFAPKGKSRWVRQLAKWQKRVANEDEFENGLKFDFFKDRIFVFTPLGDVKELPEEATAIDFAYAVHSEVGDKMTGAKVDGKMVKISDPLENGQVVEIITAKNSPGPKSDWLTFAKTGGARSKIRAALRKKI